MRKRRASKWILRSARRYRQGAGGDRHGSSRPGRRRLRQRHGQPEGGSGDPGGSRECRAEGIARHRRPIERKSAGGGAAQAVEDALTAARKDAEEAVITFTGKQADVASANQLAEATKTTYETLRLQFRARCLGAGFADHAAFKAAKLSDEALAAMDREIRDYHVAIQAAKERLERVRAPRVFSLSPDLGQLTSDDGTAQQALEAKINQAAQPAQQVRSIDAVLASGGARIQTRRPRPAVPGDRHSLRRGQWEERLQHDVSALRAGCLSRRGAERRHTAVRTMCADVSCWGA